MAISIAIAAAKLRLNNPMMGQRPPTVFEKHGRAGKGTAGDKIIFRHHATHTSMTWARYLEPAVHDRM